MRFWRAGLHSTSFNLAPAPEQNTNFTSRLAWFIITTIGFTGDFKKMLTEEKRVRAERAFERISNMVLDRAFNFVQTRDLGSLSVIAHSKKHFAEAISQEAGLPTTSPYCHELAQKIIDHVASSIAKPYIKLRSVNDIHNIDNDTAKGIKQLFIDEYTVPKFWDNNGFFDELVLHPVFYEHNTPLPHQHISLIMGNIPTAKSNGFLNLETGNPDVIFNPLTNALLSLTESHALSAFRAGTFDKKRLDYYQANHPEHLAIENAMFSLYRAAQNIKAPTKEEEFAFANSMGELLSLKPEPELHLSASVKAILENIESQISLADLSQLVSSLKLDENEATKHLLMKWDFDKDTLHADAEGYCRKAAEAGMFAFSLMRKIESLCEIILGAEGDRAFTDAMALARISQICVDLAKPITVACADMDLPHLCSIVPPSQLLHVTLPLKSLQRFIHTKEFTRHDARLAMIALHDQLGVNKALGKPYEQFFDIGHDAVFDCVLTLCLAHEGLEHDNGMAGIYNDMCSEIPQFETRLDESLIKAKAMHAHGALEGKKEQNHQADMDFLKGMRV